MAGPGFLGGGPNAAPARPKGFLGGNPNMPHGPSAPPHQYRYPAMTEDDALHINQAKGLLPTAEDQNGLSFGQMGQALGEGVLKTMTLPVTGPAIAAGAIKNTAKRWYDDPQQMNPFRPGSDVREGIIKGAEGAWNIAAMPLNAFAHGVNKSLSNEPYTQGEMAGDAIMAGLPSPAMGLVPGLGNGVATTSAFANAPKAAAPLAAMGAAGDSLTGYDLPLSKRYTDRGYGARPPVDESGTVTRSIDGDPIVAKHIAGIRDASGSNVGLSRDELERVASQWAKVSPASSRLPGGAVAQVSASPLRRLAALFSGDHPSYEMKYQTAPATGGAFAPGGVDRLIAHETGHVMNDVGGLLKQNPELIRDADLEAADMYHALNTGKIPGATDALVGPYQYPKWQRDEEKLAEALRGYMRQPGEFKERYPQLAKSIRQAVNTNPKLNKTIQFNANAPESASPLAALLAGNANPKAETSLSKLLIGNDTVPAMAKTVDDYHGQHGAPGPDSGSPLHDVTANGTYPADFYGPNGLRYYGTGDDAMDPVTYRKIVAAKGSPRAQVTVYRAVPHEPSVAEQLDTLEAQMAAFMKRRTLPPDATVPASQWYDDAYARRNALRSALQSPAAPTPELGVNPGDWVTINKQYAVDHGQSALNGKYRVLSKKVPADELFTSGDSMHEWGWHPRDKSRR